MRLLLCNQAPGAMQLTPAALFDSIAGRGSSCGVSLLLDEKKRYAREQTVGCSGVDRLWQAVPVARGYPQIPQMDDAPYRLAI